MPVGMIDPTQMTGYAMNAPAASKKEPAEPEAFEKEFHRALAPPGDESPPPESEKLSGPEESPTKSPNAQSSQMDPQPQVTPLPFFVGVPDHSVPATDSTGSDKALQAVANPLVPATPKSPLQALDIQSVQAQAVPAFNPADLLEKVPDTRKGDIEPTEFDVPTEDGDESPKSKEGEARPALESLRSTPKEQPTAKPVSEPDRSAPIHSRAKLQDHLDLIATKSQRLEVKIEMNPMDLGPMTVQVSQEGKEIKAHAVVENPALRLALDRQQADLTAALSEAGMNLTDFSMESGQRFEKPSQGPAFFAPRHETISQRTHTATGNGLELWI